MEKLRLLLDENIGARTAQELRLCGFDVASILEDASGATDNTVLKRAQKEKRIIVTLDRDFGTLVFRDSKPHVGVLFLRLQKESHENITSVMMDVLKQHGEKLSRRFTVATEKTVRIR